MANAGMMVAEIDMLLVHIAKLQAHLAKDGRHKEAITKLIDAKRKRIEEVKLG